MIFQIKNTKKYPISIPTIISNFNETIFTKSDIFIRSNLSTIEISKIISSNKISILDKNIIILQTSQVQDWIKAQLLKDETEKYERENQELLNDYNIVINNVREDLELQLKNKTEGSVENCASEENNSN